jgi:hypothetical protein
VFARADEVIDRVRSACDPTRTSDGKRVVKSFRHLLTDPRQFDILQSGQGWGDRMQFDQLKRHEVITFLGGVSSDNLDISHFCLLWFWNDDSIFNNRIFVIR